MKFKDTIGIFENAFSTEECKDLIKRQEDTIKNGTAYKGSSGDKGEEGPKKTTDYNILHQNNSIDDNLSIMVTERFNDYVMKYLDEFPGHETFNHSRIVIGNTNYPLLQLQKYDKGSGHYNAWHVEKENTDSASRMFVFILYLNNVKKGGETGFLFKENEKDDFFKVKPEEGKLIIHPASWPYIHKGHMPTSSNKYILTTWLCYIS